MFILSTILAAIIVVTPTNNLQTAINNSTHGDTILVEPGTYGPIDIAYKNIEVRSTTGPYYTILDASNTTRTVYLQKNNLYAGEPILNGFTIINGTAIEGGGVYIKRGGTLHNCFIMYNNATNFGGGVYEVKTDYGGTISNCIIASNTAQTGGGLYMYLGGDVQDTYVYSNKAFIADNVKYQATNIYGCVINNLKEHPPSNYPTFQYRNISETNIGITFTSLIGLRYEVQYTINLLGNIQSIDSFYGNGFLIYRNLPLPNNKGYYKIYCFSE